MFPKSTNETFATKLFQQYRNHKRLSKPKLGRTDFTINHYAGDVSISSMLRLRSVLFDILILSECPAASKVIQCLLCTSETGVFCNGIQSLDLFVVLFCPTGYLSD